MRTAEDVKTNPIVGDVVQGVEARFPVQRSVIEQFDRGLVRNVEYTRYNLANGNRHNVHVSLISWKKWCRNATVLHVAEVQA